jgi:hypothetical protein
MGEREFWVVYDYGMGGVWAIARAASDAELRSAFPELTIVDERPSWMTPEREANIRKNSSFVVGDSSSYPDWLKVLLQDR